MSYRGYIPFLKEISKAHAELKEVGKPLRILEIGVNEGLTTVPFAVNLMLEGIPFVYEAVDIKIQERVREMTSYIPGLRDYLLLIQSSSIEYLTVRNEFYDRGDITPWDIILVDGDHSYETVAQECGLLERLIGPETVILFDDYRSDDPTFGVKRAVDEFMARGKYYNLHTSDLVKTATTTRIVPSPPLLVFPRRAHLVLDLLEKHKTAGDIQATAAMDQITLQQSDEGEL